MTPPLPVPPEAETAVKALEVAKKAYRISVGAFAASLLIGGGSLIFAAQQAEETRRANNVVQSTRAQSVTFEAASTGLAGSIQHSIVNRNKEPIYDLYYVYRTSDVGELRSAVVGALSGCTLVRVVPPIETPGSANFDLVRVGFRDSLGQTWQRDALGVLAATAANEFTVTQPRTAGTTQRVDGC